MFHNRKQYPSNYQEGGQPLLVQEMTLDPINEYTSYMFQFRTQLHVWHFQTKSLNEHKGLNHLYDNILDLIDGFIETYQGINDSVIMDIQGGSFENFQNTQTILAYLAKTLVFLTEFQNSLQSSELVNMIDEQKSLIGKFRYLLGLA